MCIFEFCQKRRNGHLRALIGYRSCNGFERKCVWLQVASFTVAANDLSCPPSAWRRSFSGGASFSVGGPSAFCPLPSALPLHQNMVLLSTATTSMHNRHFTYLTFKTNRHVNYS